VFLTAVACTPPAALNQLATAPAVGAVALGRTMTVRMSGDWSSLDPHRLSVSTTMTGSNQIMHAVYDRLVMIAQGKIVPYLATSWQQAPTSITFKIRNVALGRDQIHAEPGRRQLEARVRSEQAVRMGLELRRERSVLAHLRRRCGHGHLHPDRAAW
jgi:hypothetical protein